MEVIGAMVLFGVVGWALSQAQRQTSERAWADAARQLKLRYEVGGLFSNPRIVGTRSGMQVVVDVARDGSGKSNKATTRYSISFPQSLGLGLDLRAEGFLEGLGRLFGVTNEVSVGDPEFDAAIYIRGADPQRVRAFLTPARRVRIQRFLRTYPGARISDGGIFVPVNGIPSGASHIVTHVRAALDLAAHLEVERPADRSLDQAAAQRQRGELGGALTTLRESRRAAGEDADVREQEGEILYTSGRYGEAKEAFDAAQKGAPGDPDIAAWAEAAGAKAGLKPQAHKETVRAGKGRGAPVTPPPAGQPAAPAAARPTAGQSAAPAAASPTAGQPAAPAMARPTAAQVCAALFGPTMSSVDTTKLFEQKFKGAHVQWSGTLRWVDAATFDLVFGFEPVGRAIIEVCAVTPGLSGGRAVSALVRLPGDTSSALKDRVGQTVEFEGTLTSVDAFARNLYVVDGRVLEANRAKA